MLPLAFVRPLWSATLRSLRAWSGVAMTAMMLAVGISDGQPTGRDIPQVTVDPPAAVVAPAPGTQLAPAPVALRHDGDIDHVRDRRPAPLAHAVVPPHLGAGDAPLWDTSPRDPDGDAHPSTLGQRGPPRA